jgi:uncharacterized membrane protein
MLVLRFKYKGERGWKVPPNLTIGGIEFPIGIASVFLVLFCVAVTNLFTKSVATQAGIAFSAAFFVIFTISERVNRRKHAAAELQMKEHFQLLQRDTVDSEGLAIRPGSVLVTVRDYNTMNHLKWVLGQTNTRDQDIVVMSARISQTGAGAYDLAAEQIFSDYEQTLFTKAVSVAESFGKKIALLVVPAADVWSAIAHTAKNLECSAVVAGLSTKMTAEEQAFYLGRAWETIPEPKLQFVLQVIKSDANASTVSTFRIGPHTPSMKNEDVLLVHRLWLNLTREPGLESLHHHDILTEAVARFAHECTSPNREAILDDLREIETRRSTTTTPVPACDPPQLHSAPQPAKSEEKDSC